MARHPGGQPNMNQLLKQAQKMQQQMMDAQEELANAEATGQAGGGLVTATVNGSGELRSLQIDPRAVESDSDEAADLAETAETLADLVVAAVRAAQEKASELTQQKLGPLAGGAPGMPGLPGTPSGFSL